jgi:hypothetical protein
LDAAPMIGASFFVVLHRDTPVFHVSFAFYIIKLKKNTKKTDCLKKKRYICAFLNGTK